MICDLLIPYESLIPTENSCELDSTTYLNMLQTLSNGGDVSYDGLNARQTNNGYDFCDVPCKVCDINGDDEKEETLKFYKSNGEMFVLILELMGEIKQSDADYVMIEWLTDSNNILNRQTLSEETKIMNLPIQFLKVKVGENNYNLHECKIVEIYNKNKFAIIVNKVTN